MHIIYGLIDPVTLIIRYVGRSSWGLTRPKAHWTAKGRTRVANWIKGLRVRGAKYLIVVLEHTAPENIAQCEMWWIAYGRLSGWNLTNLTDGGEGAIGVVRSPETRKRLSSALTGRKASAETCANMSAAKSTPDAIAFIRRLHTGRKRSVETRARIGAASKGRVPSEEARARMGNAARGRVKTDETRRKLSEALTGKPKSTTHINNMRLSRTGKKASDETRQKMSDTHKKRWAAKKR